MAFDSLLSPKEEASFQLGVECYDTRERRWGSVGLTQLRFNCVFTVWLLLPQGRAVWENTLIFTSPERCVSVVHVTSSSVSSCQKRGLHEKGHNSA